MTQLDRPRSVQKDLCRYPFGFNISRWWDLRQANQKKLREKRKNEIVLRIHAEGYGNELEGLPIWRLPGTKKSTKKLNDQDWERMKPGLIQMLETKRQTEKMTNELRSRLDQLSEIVTEFHSSLPEPAIIPPLIHFARIPPFVDFIKDTVKMNDSEFQGLISSMPSITSSWRASADECLLNLLPQKSGNKKGKETSIANRLELATTFFKCEWCHEPISYPRVLMHECLRQRHDADEEDKNGRKAVEQVEQVDSVWNKFQDSADWNEGKDQITFDHDALLFARVIVKASGEDPDKVTFDQMDKIDARFECLRCSRKGRKRGRLVMNWTTAILHDLEKHLEERGKYWVLIDKEDTDKAKVLECRLLDKIARNAETPSSPLALDRSMKGPPYAVRI